MMHIDTVRNKIGGAVNTFLANGEISPTEMRYILKAILGEVAEMELTQNYIAQAQSNSKREQSEENNG